MSNPESRPSGALARAEQEAIEQELANRLAFLGLTEADAQRLRELAPHFTACSEEFVREFYDHLFAFPETARFLQDPLRLERVKRAQRHHFESLLAAEWDEEYVEERRRAGEVHADLEVQPEYFIGAYNQYAQFCFRSFANKKLGSAIGTSDQGLEWLLSLLKAIFLDIGLTLDAYFMHSTLALQQALDLYWRANEELRRFAQLASHDLKTPLATVANRCEEVLDEFGEQMPEEARELVAQARGGVFRMSRLIDELLASTIARHEPGANDLFDSRAAVEEAIDRVRPVLDEKGIQLRTPKEYPRIWGDPVRFREALYNLLSNAAKFLKRENGKIRIDVAVNKLDCEFSIADNGPGIPAEELERIFVPFRRLPMHRSEPGSGLGLYFTKTLVEAQGGKVWAESELGHGSCFYIRMPRVPPKNPGKPA